MFVPIIVKCLSTNFLNNFIYPHMLSTVPVASPVDADSSLSL